MLAMEQGSETIVARAKRLGVPIVTLAREADVDGRRIYNNAPLRPDEETRCTSYLDAVEGSR